MWTLPLFRANARLWSTCRRRPTNAAAPSRPTAGGSRTESDASGRTEIYVSAFPVAQERITVSRDGGRAPVWNAKSSELFFLTLDGRLMAAQVGVATGFKAAVPKAPLPDPDRHVRQLPPIRRCEGRPAVSDSSPARGARLDADHRRFKLASNSAEVTKRPVRVTRAHIWYGRVTADVAFVPMPVRGGSPSVGKADRYGSQLLS